MDKPTFADLASAQAAQNEKKVAVKNAKAKLTDYYKENGLKRNEDYSKDKKHGKEIDKLQNRIDKRSNELEAINEAVKSFDPKNKKAGKTKEGKSEKGEKAPSKNLKYEYPDDVNTPDARKKYRIEQRKLAAGESTETKSKKTKKEEKPNVETKPKKTKGDGKKKEEVKDNPLTETKGKKGAKKVSSKKKVSKKQVEEDIEDDND